MKLLTAAWPIMLVLVLSLFFTTCTTEIAVPTVATSNPEDGETGVDTAIGEMTITFDRIMDGGVSIDYGSIPNPVVPTDLTATNGWVDERNYKFEFDPLTPTTTYTVTLNPAGLPLDFRSAQNGILEADTTISFTTGP